MIFRPTKRDYIFERFFEHAKNYRYFYFEEDSTTEYDTELFGYSKFTCDAVYSDDEVQWNYIVKNQKILGIIALKTEGKILRVKFLEINSRYRNKGLGTEAIELLKSFVDNGKYEAIILYPKNDKIAENFYKPLGFKDNGNEELIYN